MQKTLKRFAFVKVNKGRSARHTVRSTHNATELNNKVIKSVFNKKEFLLTAWPADIRRPMMINTVYVCLYVCPAGPPCLRGPWRGWRGLRDVCRSPCVVARRSMNRFQSWRNRWPSRRTAARTAVSVICCVYIVCAGSPLMLSSSD